ncbi:protein of unknown function [Kyrpidia spormannii]|uniref:Uncharacterized protein n=2 Tax=Kyrpidia spormannii TaxID=2055160 RepID=A0ACA8Z902_9BACL|nr:protein of unknown function [Kyrpidia spormannii]CAB3391977.1 protein of unknown function [Kyrpidia spormannii]
MDGFDVFALARYLYLGPRSGAAHGPVRCFAAEREALWPGGCSGAGIEKLHSVIGDCQLQLAMLYCLPVEDCNPPTVNIAG